MHQHSYIQDVVKRFGMESCRSVETPFDPRIRLCKSGAYVSKSGEYLAHCATAYDTSGLVPILIHSRHPISSR